MIKWSSMTSTLGLSNCWESRTAFQESVENESLHQLLFNWKRNLLDLTDMRMTLQQLTSWGNYLSHTPVWPPSAQYKSPSSVLLCLHAHLVRMQLPAARYNRCIRRGLPEWTPLAIQTASSCKDSGFIGFVFNFFCWISSFSALSTSLIYIFGDPLYHQRPMRTENKFKKTSLRTDVIFYTYRKDINTFKQANKKEIKTQNKKLP